MVSDNPRHWLLTIAKSSKMLSKHFVFALVATATAKSIPPRATSNYGLWTYQGCYVDSLSNRYLPDGFSRLNTMTIGTCLSYCDSLGFPVAGTGKSNRFYQSNYSYVLIDYRMGPRVFRKSFLDKHAIKHQTSVVLNRIASLSGLHQYFMTFFVNLIQPSVEQIRLISSLPPAAVTWAARVTPTTFVEDPCASQSIRTLEDHL